MRHHMLAGLGLLAVMAANQAEARISVDHTYRYEQIWNASVRLLRVDYGFEILDKDRNVGFVLFKYRDRQREVDGSIELVRTETNGRSYIRVAVSIPQMPRYIEQMIVDRLARKLVEDFGEPPPARRRPPASATPDPDEEPSNPGEGEEDDQDP